MSKRLFLVVLLPCVAVLAETALAQTPLIAGQPRHADDAVNHSKPRGATYPQFSYPSPSTGTNATPAHAPRHRPATTQLSNTPDPYASDGWTNPSYDPPSLDEPWSARAPADQLPQPGQ